MPNVKKPFVDFRAVRVRITMEQMLAHYNVLDAFKRSGSRFSGPCPIHGGSNPSQFPVDTDQNLWNCFSECKHGGNTLDFIAKEEDISIHDAALKACEWFGISIEEITDDESRRKREKLEERPVNGASQTTPKPITPGAISKLEDIQQNLWLTGRENIACRRSKFCFVKFQQFEMQGPQPEHLFVEEADRLGGVM